MIHYLSPLVCPFMIPTSNVARCRIRSTTSIHYAQYLSLLRRSILLSLSLHPFGSFSIAWCTALWESSTLIGWPSSQLILAPHPLPTYNLSTSPYIIIILFIIFSSSSMFWMVTHSNSIRSGSSTSSRWSSVLVAALYWVSSCSNWTLLRSHLIQFLSLFLCLLFLAERIRKSVQKKASSTSVGEELSVFTHLITVSYLLLLL